MIGAFGAVIAALAAMIGAFAPEIATFGAVTGAFASMITTIGLVIAAFEAVIATFTPVTPPYFAVGTASAGGGPPASIISGSAVGLSGTIGVLPSPHATSAITPVRITAPATTARTRDMGLFSLRVWAPVSRLEQPPFHRNLACSKV